MVVWTGSVVSLLYEAVYSSVSFARFERELGRVRESLLVLYDCLLQIIIVSSRHFHAWSLGRSHSVIYVLLLCEF